MQSISFRKQKPKKKEREKKSHQLSVLQYTRYTTADKVITKLDWTICNAGKFPRCRELGINLFENLIRNSILFFVYAL